MKISNHIFFSLTLLTLFSCIQGTEKRVCATDGGTTETVAPEGSDGHEVSCEKEDFDQFIHKYSTQESFQMERTRFPVIVTVPDAEREGMPPMGETVGRYEWELLDLTYDSSYLTRPYDQYHQNIRYEKDTAVVEIRGINNGIYADYYFTVIDEKWYLVTLCEASF
jgi:hypothetical protein